MALIPNRDLIKSALDFQEEEPQNFGSFMGMSNIGHDCIRYLQYTVRRAYPDSISPKLKRIFNMGHFVEKEVIAELKSIGAVITNEQDTVFDHTGCWKGKVDGLISNLPGCEKTIHVLEIKSHNDKNFQKLVKTKDLRIANHKHYGQICIYMKYMKVNRGLYVAYNKNTSEYYIERIYEEPDYANELNRKTMEVLASDQLYPRIGTGTKTWHACRYCPAKEVCFDEAKPRKNCRTCDFVEMTNGNLWSCTLAENSRLLSTEEQILGCEHYELEELLK